MQRIPTAEKEPLIITHQPSSNYGSSNRSSCTSFIKMDAENSGNDQRNAIPSSSLGQTTESQNRRISVSNVFIPRTRRTWYEYFRLVLKSLYQLQFRRTSPRSNQIHTTKYTLLTFLPKNLFEQFHRLANIYFLLIIVLNFIPAIEVFGKEVSWVPLTCILLITACKDAFEDYRRYKSDRVLNGLPCHVYDFDQADFVSKHWKDVCVGDFIRLSCDDTIPADLLLLWSSDTDDICYIQTSNLDGETNLKQRQVPVGMLEKDQPSETEQDQDYSSCNFNPLSFTGELFCEPPNEHVYKFRGFAENLDGSVVPLSHSHLLLRGCILRNTDCVVGVVIYAGHETKAMLNNSGTRAKRSKLERDINTAIISQVLLLFFLCTVGAIMSGVWTGQHINMNIVYFPFTNSNANPALEGFVRFWSFVIILQVIIPISLYVSLEIVKFSQIFFLNWDLDMYYEKLDRPFECRALNINEDLGQIKYVFSDKTGTLTENEMVFKCCSINGENYLHSLTQNEDHHISSFVKEETDYPNPSSVCVNIDKLLAHNINNTQPFDTVIHDFMITMAICNTVVVSRRAKSSSLENGNVDCANIYEAESPDEYALVEGACSYGYVLLSRSPTLIRLKTPNSGIIELEPLHTLEFSSDRKRMSVIVRDKSTNTITLYCKGADSVIFSRLSSESSMIIQTDTQDHLDQYARLGLRTLCLAKKILSVDDYKEWLIDYKNAELNLENREELIIECASKIENKLQLLGATGIEDKLQDGVEDTIMSLRKAGMKVWVLTGDKKETAINVGYASGLLTENMEIVHLKAKSEAECLDSLRAHIPEMFPSLCSLLEASHSSILTNTIERVQSPFIKLRSTLSWSTHSTESDNSLINQSSLRLRALVVDGATLNFAFKPSCKDLFVAVAKECYSVICCRASPFQKAHVVELIKHSEPSSLILAIGDGANDVSMIQMANVGIGIAGREGMQAVLASDFNMGRFKFLKKLLLVHGHWCYSRLANMMLYFFYKNVMYAVLLFWFQFFNGFSGSNPIDGLNLQIFNLVYTSIPIMIAAVADQDLKPKELLTNHVHYQRGQQSRVYTKLKFWLIMLEAFYQSIVIFFVAYGTYYNSTIGIVEFGFVINIAAVIVASLHLALEILHWTWLHHFFLWGSLLLLFVLNYVYCALNTQQRIMDTYYIMQELSGDSRFWFVLLITPIIALFPRVIGKILNQDVFPDTVLVARNNERKSRKRLRIIDGVPQSMNTLES